MPALVQEGEEIDLTSQWRGKLVIVAIFGDKLPRQNQQIKAEKS